MAQIRKGIYASESPPQLLYRVMAPFCSRSIALAAALLVVPVTRVSACEGECKAGVTTALVGNYSVLMEGVFAELVRTSRSYIACIKSIYLNSMLGEWAISNSWPQQRLSSILPLANNPRIPGSGLPRHAKLYLRQPFPWKVSKSHDRSRPSWLS